MANKDSRTREALLRQIGNAVALAVTMGVVCLLAAAVMLVMGEPSGGVAAVGFAVIMFTDAWLLWR